MDETLREGMQYRGVMFSLKQRLNILDFQEQLGVDICQAGYPSAHAQEAKILAALVDHAQKNHYRIRMAAMGRAIKEDAAVMINTGVSEMNLHLHIPPGIWPPFMPTTNTLIPLSISSLARTCSIRPPRFSARPLKPMWPVPMQTDSSAWPPKSTII